MAVEHQSAVADSIFPNRKNLGILIAAIFIIAARSTTAQAAPPNGPRTFDSEAKAYFQSLTVPRPPHAESLKAYFISQTAEDILAAIGASQSRDNQHCCGVGDCDYVKSRENSDGSFTVYLGDKFRN